MTPRIIEGLSNLTCSDSARVLTDKLVRSHRLCHGIAVGLMGCSEFPLTPPNVTLHKKNQVNRSPLVLGNPPFPFAPANRKKKLDFFFFLLCLNQHFRETHPGKRSVFKPLAKNIQRLMVWEQKYILYNITYLYENQFYFGIYFPWVKKKLVIISVGGVGGLSC